MQAQNLIGKRHWVENKLYWTMTIYVQHNHNGTPLAVAICASAKWARENERCVCVRCTEYICDPGNSKLGGCECECSSQYVILNEKS